VDLARAMNSDHDAGGPLGVGERIKKSKRVRARRRRRDQRKINRRGGCRRALSGGVSARYAFVRQRPEDGLPR